MRFKVGCASFDGLVQSTLLLLEAVLTEPRVFTWDFLECDDCVCC